jgi:lysophospholipase L1-like esterase
MKSAIYNGVKDITIEEIPDPVCGPEVSHLKFNLIKAYTDIGLSDDNAALNASIYGLTPEEYTEAERSFAENNRIGAESVINLCGPFEADPGITKKIAYIGDSITSDRESHMNIVRTILKEYPGVDIRDLSISGYKASDVFTAYYPSIASYAPDIAVIMIGTNDMRITDDEYAYHHGGIDEYARNIDYILAKLYGAGCSAIICTLPPFDMEKTRVVLKGWPILYTEESRSIYDNCIIKAAERNDATLIDMRDIYGEHDAADITTDEGLHLNVKGQALLAQQIFPKLAALLTS